MKERPKALARQSSADDAPHHYLCVLGYANDESGGLLATSRSRVARAVAAYRDLTRDGRSCGVIATGGHAERFNRAPRPHREYVQRELIRLGVDLRAIVRGAFDSANTVEDAVLIGRFLASRQATQASIVTSAFHLARARLIFGSVLPGLSLSFLEATDPVDLPQSVLTHEAEAIERLRQQGGVVYRGEVFPL